MSYRVRRVAAHEWLRLRDLRLEALQDTPTAFVSQYATERMKSDTEWQSRALCGSGAEAQADGRLTATYVLEPAGSGRWGGMVTVFQEPDAVKPQVHLVGVYVAPEYRGRAVGAAEALVREALEWAFTEGGAERVRLFVREDNGRALAFYRRLGFAETGETMLYPPDPSFTEFEMEYLAGA
ncbi:GNAT family N-acetyltransferase [Peterkaempfera bronchialis]|uniref:GNAT family N-acetyltransferase n=1 Tax=Peterkaempfera bronchialis TaxID=2126346 RepID=A0A345SVQ0_9ACTN|nr:N-acetyltransferase [Peterkaempfera bronchialis]AXI77805.1 GNAT family N-acetyltransferase [Peterkaempfera bronchialis]